MDSDEVDRAQAERALEHLRLVLPDLDTIFGCGIFQKHAGGYAIKVVTSESIARLPTEIDGVDVVQAPGERPRAW